MATPEAYVVPLRDDGHVAGSYVFAVTRWLTEGEVAEILPSAANFSDSDVPYRADEVIQLPLDAEGLQRIPSNLFARVALARFDWSTGTEAEFVTIIDEYVAQRGHAIRLSDTCLILREGERASAEGGLPPGNNALWRDIAATIIIDLDDTLRNHTVQALRALVSPFNTAAAVYGTESMIVADRGHKWDKKRARFLSPDESLALFQEERLAALDELGAAFFEVATTSSQRAAISDEIATRAETNDVPRADQRAADKRTNLALALAMSFGDAVQEMTERIWRSPPRLPVFDRDNVTGTWAPEIGVFYEELIRALRAKLNRLSTEDYLHDPAWRRRDYHVPLTDGNTPSEPESDPLEAKSIDEALIERYGSELLGRASLTPSEKRVLAGIWSGEYDTLAEWAEANGMSASTARVHRMNAKNRLLEAMKSI